MKKRKKSKNNKKAENRGSAEESHPCAQLKTSMPGVEFEPADYSTKWQRPTTRPSPGLLLNGQYEDGTN